MTAPSGPPAPEEAIQPADPEGWMWELVVASALLLAIGLAACVVPTLRGLRIPPVEALRS